MKNYKVTIIVPVYNSRTYLAKCLDSLIIQDYSNIEIILVDDGSTDGSSNIIDEYVVTDSRFIAIHQKNRGVSAARNVGLKKATGDWIVFVDSDDVVEKNMCSRLLDMANRHQVDAVMYEYSIDYSDGRSSCHKTGDNNYYGRLEPEKAIEHIYKGACFLWAVIFSRKIIKDVYFREDIFRGEDTIFLLQSIQKAEYVYSTSEVLYHYIQSAESLTRSGITARQLTGIDALKWMLEFADKYYPNLHRIAVVNYVNIMVEFYYEMYTTPFVVEEVEKRIFQETKHFKFEALDSALYRQKWKYRLFFLSPYFFVKILKIFRGAS